MNKPFHHFTLEEKGQLCFINILEGQLPDGWLKTPFIKKKMILKKSSLQIKNRM